MQSIIQIGLDVKNLTRSENNVCELKAKLTFKAELSSTKLG